MVLDLDDGGGRTNIHMWQKGTELYAHITEVNFLILILYCIYVRCNNLRIQVQGAQDLSYCFCKFRCIYNYLKIKSFCKSFTGLRLQRKSVFPKTIKELKLAVVGKVLSTPVSPCLLPLPQPVGSAAKRIVLCGLEVRVRSNWAKYTNYPLLVSPHKSIPEQKPIANLHLR